MHRSLQCVAQGHGGDAELPTPRTAEWYAAVTEDIIDPQRPIVDPHHHLWASPSMWGTYLLDDLWADTESGHNIDKTVFIDCRSGYRTEGPEHLRPVGETEFIASIAAKSAERKGAATIAGIVSHANMLLGEDVAEVLEAHEAAGGGLFRGIRHAGPYDTTGTLTNAGRGRPCPYGEDSFRTGVRTLGKLGYTYDTWHFFHQNRDYLALAPAVP
jgi:predicted TIM-barrel fold metal-dependent hydrolase